MVILSEVLKSLAPSNPEEQSVLQSVLKFAQSCLSEKEPPKQIAALPEESRTYFFGLVEALEIYQSVHGTAATSLTSLNDAAVAELRKIRDICLQGGTHAYY